MVYKKGFNSPDLRLPLILNTVIHEKLQLTIHYKVDFFFLLIICV